MKAKKVVCIVPVFNGEKYLSEALDSIITQTYRSIKIIVVDDGSTDGTPAVVNRYGPEITYIRQQNAGPAAARNVGLRVTESEFVAFLDSDDLWHPEKIERQMSQFDTDPSLDICTTHIQNFWSPELISERKRFNDPGLTAPWAGYNCQTLLAKRNAFLKVGYFDPELRVGEDGDWFMRAGRIEIKHKILPEVLTYRRLHQNNLTRRMAQASRDALLNRVKTILEHKRQK